MATHGRSLYPSIDMEQQRVAADTFADLLDLARTLKGEVIEEGDEDAAARLLMAECFSQGMERRARLWIAVREGEMSEAWSNLVGAQGAMEAAIRAHPYGIQFAQILGELEALERIVFPPQTFFSTGMLIKESHCSICQKPFGSCEHIKGRVYDGQFAARVITELDLLEVSVVDTPDDKRCRAFIVKDADGVSRDMLTGALVEDPP